MVVDYTLNYAVARWPDYIAVIEDDQPISYRELSKACEEMQSALMKAGICAGMGLAVMGRNSSAFIVAMLAGIGCGATVLPISSQLTQAEVDHIIEDTGLHALLDDGSGMFPVSPSALPIFYMKQKLYLSWTDQPQAQSITPMPDAAFVRYTSGTTGLSKGVVLSHQRIIERVQAAQLALPLEPDEGVLWVLPMAYHFLVTILAYLRSGARIILSRDILAHTLINAANKHRAELFYAAPMHYRLLGADRSGKRFNYLRRAISTSSAIPVSIASAFKQRFNISVIQAYGIIEAGLPLMDHFSDLARAESVGFPVKNFKVALFDKQNRIIKGDESGRLAIRGPGMFNAYLKPWQDADEICKQGWFFTGDLAQWGKDGRLEICGREKSMINVSGNKAFPEEIEAVLNTHQAIKQSRVYGSEHPLMGEIVCADVVLHDNTEFHVEKILSYCRQFLSVYKIPQRLVAVSAIEHTASGKIKR